MKTVFLILNLFIIQLTWAQATIYSKDLNQLKDPNIWHLQNRELNV